MCGKMKQTKLTVKSEIVFEKKISTMTTYSILEFEEECKNKICSINPTSSKLSKTLINIK